MQAPGGDARGFRFLGCSTFPVAPVRRALPVNGCFGHSAQCCTTAERQQSGENRTLCKRAPGVFVMEWMPPSDGIAMCQGGD